MKRTYGLFIIIFLLMTRTAAAQETVRFVFNPPDGISYRETYSAQRTKEFGSLKKQVDQTEGTVKVVIKKTEQGYSLKAVPLLITMTRDGQPVPDSITQPMFDMKYDLHLDPDGHFVYVNGFEEFVEKMKAGLPANTPAEILKSISVEAMVNKEKAEYNGRVGDFIGREITVGETWLSESQFTLPDGNTIEFTAIFILRDMVPCGQTRCARIEFQYDANPAGLTKFMDGMYGGIKEMADGALDAVDLGDVKLSGSGVRLIDPQTMLIYSEEMNRLFETPMTLANGAKIPVTMTEVKQYGYKYDQ
ncbi:MAG: hypothetical protein AB7S78_12985 [Candidatus Omnitrophota bacterium]